MVVDDIIVMFYDPLHSIYCFKVKADVFQMDFMDVLIDYLIRLV